MVNWESEYLSMKLKYINYKKNLIAGKGFGTPSRPNVSNPSPRPTVVPSSASIMGPGTSYDNYYLPETYTNAPRPSTNASRKHDIEISEFFRIFLKDNLLTQEWIGTWFEQVFDTYEDVINIWENENMPWHMADGNRWLIVPPGQQAPSRPNVSNPRLNESNPRPNVSNPSFGTFSKFYKKKI